MQGSRKKKILEVILHIVNEQDKFFLPMEFQDHQQKVFLLIRLYAKLAVFQLFHENVCIFCIDSIYWNKSLYCVLWSLVLFLFFFPFFW